MRKMKKVLSVLLTVGMVATAFTGCGGNGSNSSGKTDSKDTNGDGKVKVGDEITWHIFGDDNWYTCKIAGLNRDPQNQQLNMTRKYFESLGFTYRADVLYTDDDLSNTKTIY